MSRKCDLTGRRSSAGKNVSHAQNRTLRRFLPNTHKRRIWVPELGRFMIMTVSAKALRTLDKIGLNAMLKKRGMRLNDIGKK